MKFGEIAAMEDRVQKGAWVRPASFPGISLRVRGIGNADYRQALAKATRDLKPDEEVSADVMAKILQDTILIDWSGIEDRDFSPDAAKEALQATTFQNTVVWCASQVAMNGKETAEALAKN